MSAQIGTESVFEAYRREDWMAYFRASCAAHGIPLSWGLAIGRKESHFMNERSPRGAPDDALAGAWGPLQCTSALMHTLGYRRDLPELSEARGEWALHDIGRAIDIGCHALQHMRDKLAADGAARDFAAVCVAYNAGPGNAEKGFRDLPYVVPATAFQSEYTFLDAPLLDLDAAPVPT